MIDKYVIIAKTNLENVFLRYEKSERKWLYKIISLSGSAAISLTVSIFTTAKYQAVLFFSSHTSKSLIGLFAVLSWLVFIVFICIWGFFKYKKKLKDLSGLQADIINENMYKEDFTYILLIPTYNGKQLLFPVIQKDTWENSLFFPYLKHNYGNDAVSLHEQDIEKDIRAKYSISIPLRIKEIVTEDSTVTKLKEGLPKDFHFKFLYISSLSPFFRNYLYKLFEDNGFKYMSLEEINSDRITNINNGRVLGIVEENKNQIKKVYDELLKEQSKIIWNIDKSCPNRCSICAYGNDLSPAPELEELKGIVDSIVSLDVNNIDLSMGDNANIENIKGIIVYLRKKSRMTISITATANLLSKFPFDFLNDNVSAIEVTYDYPHTLADKKDLRPAEYNKYNYDFIKSISKKRTKFKINVNIVLHNNLTKENLHSIFRNLKKLPVNNYNFLRLMPLGKTLNVTYPEQLQNRKYYLDIQNVIMPKNPHVHCALSCVYPSGTKCRMGISKLGISPSGEVYVCAWAEHIEKGHANPFYIGNIDEHENLRSMLLNNQQYLDIIRHPQTKDCKIFSHVQGSGIWSKSDKLYMD
jgi:MoaA/NifB/PqqE/SkfB family radical SAM enzyme